MCFFSQSYHFLELGSSCESSSKFVLKNALNSVCFVFHLRYYTIMKLDKILSKQILWLEELTNSTYDTYSFCTCLIANICMPSYTYPESMSFRLCKTLHYSHACSENYFIPLFSVRLFCNIIF